MINGFTLLKHQHDKSFVLYLYLGSIEVASFHVHDLSEIEIDYFEGENTHYLTPKKNSICYIPLESNAAKALYPLLLCDLPVDFSRYEYFSKLNLELSTKAGDNSK